MQAMPNFVHEFKCKPNEKHYGFTSWDDLFTREFRDGIRPVASLDDDSIVANAWVSAIPDLYSREKEGLLLGKAPTVLIGLHPEHE